MPRPATTEYGTFYQRYIDMTTGTDAVEVLYDSLEPLTTFLHSIPASKADHAYAAGKWTLKALLQHCIDTERIFCYRALCIARGEVKDLPGFDENDYAANSHAEHRQWDDLIKEMTDIRRSTITLFHSFTEDVLTNIGRANGNAVTVNAIGFILAGHFLHHQQVITERYL